MRRFFDLTNPFWSMMSLLSDMLVLTLLWFFFSLPIITMIPATVALYSVGTHLNRQSGGGVIKEFVSAFFKHFKSTVLPGLLILALTAVIVVDIWYYHSVDAKIATFWLFVFIFLGLVLVSLLAYLLPLKSLYDWSWKELLIKSFLMAIRYLQWTLFMVTVNGAFLFVTVYVAPYLSLFVIGAIGWLNMKVVLMLLDREAVLQAKQ